MPTPEHWTHRDNRLIRDFEFKDFVQAFAFLTQVALAAEKQNHHPLIRNVYNRVSLELSTHDAGDVVTEKDTALATIINQFA